MNTMNPFLVFASAMMVIIAGCICVKVLDYKSHLTHGDRQDDDSPKNKKG